MPPAAVLFIKMPAVSAGKVGYAPDNNKPDAESDLPPTLGLV